MSIFAYTALLAISCDWNGVSVGSKWVFFLNYLVSVIFIGQGSGNLKWRMILQCLYRLFSFKGLQYFCCWSLLFYLMFYFQKQLVFLLYLEFVLEMLQERKLLSVVNMNGSWKSEYARIRSDEITFLKFSKRFLILFIFWIFDWILFSAFWKRFREVGIIFDKSTVVSRKIKKLFNFFLCGGYLPVKYFCIFFVGYAKISFCLYLFVLAIFLATFGFIIIILPFHSSVRISSLYALKYICPSVLVSRLI